MNVRVQNRSMWLSLNRTYFQLSFCKSRLLFRTQYRVMWRLENLLLPGKVRLVHTAGPPYSTNTSTMSYAETRLRGGLLNPCLTNHAMWKKKGETRPAIYMYYCKYNLQLRFPRNNNSLFYLALWTNT